MKKILSPEHKAKLKAGRERAKKEKRVGLIDQTETVKPVKKELQILGFGFERGDKICVPVFASERNTFKGVLFDTPKEAKEALDARRK
jgi:hypothetical protein